VGAPEFGSDRQLRHVLDVCQADALTAVSNGGLRRSRQKMSDGTGQPASFVASYLSAVMVDTW
jgi:hypothetical protein